MAISVSVILTILVSSKNTWLLYAKFKLSIQVQKMAHETMPVHVGR